MSKRIIFHIAILLFLFANAAEGQDGLLDKKVTFTIKNAPVEQIIKMLGTLSGVNFSYSSRAIRADRKISFSVKNVTLKTALERLSAQTDIEYKVIENQVVLTMKKPRDAISRKGEKHTISGYLSDALTGENLIGATVFVPRTGQGTVTNAFGFYSLTLPEGNYTLDYSYIGYQKSMENVRLFSSLRLDKKLSYSVEFLPAVVIEPDIHHYLPDNDETGSDVLTPGEIDKIPEFGGETGLIKSLQTLPGIKSHSDGSAYFFVRGGQKDQNLILLDDAPVYNPAHLFGFYSIFIPDFTKEIKVYKEDMPVYQGDRLSSIIDIRTKDGNLNKFELNGIVNPLVSSIAFEGPFKKEKSAYFAALRHSNFKWLYQKTAPGMTLYFTDLNTKLNFKINKKNRLFISLYAGKDELLNANRGIGWTNIAGTIRWNKLFGNRLFSNTLFCVSGYTYSFSLGDVTWTSGITNKSFKTDFTFYKKPEVTMKFGYNLNAHEFYPGNISDNEIAGVANVKSLENVFYFQSVQEINKKWSFKLGARLPVWSDIGPTQIFSFDEQYNVKDTTVIGDKTVFKTFVNLDPRANLRFRPDTTSSLTLSAGIYHQYIQLLSNSTRPFTSLDVWLPAGENIAPQKAQQIALTYTKYFKNSGFEWQIAGYYKLMSHQIDYRPHAKMLLNPLIEGELRFGDAKAYGLELSLMKKTGKLTGRMNYTLSKVIKHIPGLNDGKEYPAFYDRPHDFNIFLNYGFSKRTNLSANWMYYTGSAISSPTGFYEFNGTTLPLYGEKNADRLPAYHRLDLALKVQLNKRPRKYTHSLTFSLYNAYFQKNPISLNFNKIKTKNGKYVVPTDVFGDNELITTQTDLIRFMPSLTYKFSFVGGKPAGD